MMVIRILVVVFAFVFCIPLYVVAENKESPVEIKPLYPSNHASSTMGYFDLTVQPGDQLTLTSRVTNNTEEDINIRGESANAFSSPDGGILYESVIDSPSTVLLDDAVRLADYMDTGESVEIPANSSKEVPVQVTVPESDGETLLGAIIYSVEGNASSQQQEIKGDEANFILETKMAYSIAVKLNLPNKVKSDFSLGNAGFIPETAQVFIEMTNNAHLIQEEIAGSYTVSDDKGDQLFTGEFASFKMAPKSQIHHPFAWNQETLEDGTYTLSVIGMAGSDEFAAKETFTIKNDDVETYAETIQPTVADGQQGGIPVWLRKIGRAHV